MVLHKLCHLINELGIEAYLWPFERAPAGFAQSALRSLLGVSPQLRRWTGKGFKRNAAFNTPVISFWQKFRAKQVIVVYPEVIDGNPLRAESVVRWFLHRPGFHTGRAIYHPGEYHVDFKNFLTAKGRRDRNVRERSLFVVHFPFELYNEVGSLNLSDRYEVAYCVRKGRMDGSVDVQSAICIDGLSHADASAILKRAKYFYSFDPYTAYSSFAALCGAISVVVPPTGWNKDDWYPDETDRYGIAFGLTDLEWAVSTRHLVLPTLKERELEAKQEVKEFVDDACHFFGLVL